MSRRSVNGRFATRLALDHTADDPTEIVARDAALDLNAQDGILAKPRRAWPIALITN